MHRPTLAVAVLLGLCTSAIAVAKPTRDIHAQYLIDRGHAEKTPSMQGKYIDPCEPPGKERRWWKPLPDPALDEARAELERYRNVLSCKSIKTQHVPDADLENDWHKAMSAKDAAEARRLAQKLRASAMSIRIDRAFLQRRMREMAYLRTATKLPAGARAQIDAYFADADRELAAGRIGSANLILNYLLVDAMSYFVP